MNSLETDLQDWQRMWQTEANAAPAIPDLRRHVMRETRLARLGLLAPLAVTVGFGGSIGWRAMQSGQPADVSLAVGVWLFITFAWTGCLWLARGTWTARDETTAAFIDVSVARCDSWIHAVPFSVALYIGELGFVALWCLRYLQQAPWEVLTSWPMIVIGWLGLPGFLLLLARLGRRKRAQRDYLVSLQRQFAEG